MLRTPAVAGIFYPGDEKTLRETLAKLLEPIEQKQKALAIIVPHAGYIYSGKCAAHVYSRVTIPRTAIILGVDHYGSGKSCAIDAHQSWKTPLGITPIDHDLRQKFSTSKIFVVDPQAGKREHSLEVQIPFLQFLRPDIQILPISFNSWNFQLLQAAGEELAANFNPQENLLVISTDFSHFIPAAEAQRLDGQALAAICRLDVQGLYKIVTELHLSICGLAPLTVGLTACRHLKASKVELVNYTNSGEVTGDISSVVAYASLIIS